MKRRKLRPYILLTLVLIAIGVAAFLAFASALFDKAKADSKTAMQAFVNNEINSMATELKAADEQIQLISDSLTDVQDFAQPRVWQRVQEYHDQTHFKHLLVAGLDGRAFDGVGNQYQVAKRPEVQRAFLGETGIYEGRDISGQKTILLSSPVIKDGKVTGVVIGEYDLFALYKILNMENKGGESYAALINSSGDFLIDANNNNQLVSGITNLFASLKKVQFREKDGLDKLQGAMHVKQTGFCEYSKDDGKRLMYYGPVGINDWYVVKVHTDTMIQKDIAPVKSLVLKLSLVLATVLLMFALLVYHGLASLRKEEHRQALRFKTVADNIPGGVAELALGQDLQVSYANDAFYQLLDCPEEDFVESMEGSLARFLGPENFAMLKELIDKAAKHKTIFNYEFSLPTTSYAALQQEAARQDPDRKEEPAVKSRWLHLNGRVIGKHEGKLNVQTVLVDVTPEKEHADAVEAKSKLDDMTGVYNKTSAQKMMEDRTETADSVTWGAFVVMDIDRFKGVNDHFGHLIGDEVLLKIATILKEHFKLPDITARVGGDEFTIYIDQIGGYNQLSLLLHQLQGAIKASRYSDPKLHITCSMGCVCGPRFAFRDYKKIFELADKNLYAAKTRNRGELEITFLDDGDWGPLS